MTKPKIGLSIYLSKGYIPLFEKFVKSYYQHNSELNIQWVIWLDENINIEDLHNEFKEAGFDMDFINSRWIFQKTDWVPKTVLNEKVKRAKFYQESIQYTYCKLQGLELLREYEFVIFCDVDITVHRQWDLGYLMSEGQNDIPDLFGYCQKGERGGQMDINTGFCVFHRNDNTEEDIKKARHMAVNSFKNLPDQHIIFDIFPIERCNRKMSEKYNSRFKLPFIYNHHAYGSRELKQN